MKWKTLTRNSFPDIMKKKYIVQDDTKAFRTFDTHIIKYRSKKMYIIAIDCEHMPKTCKTVYTGTIRTDDGKHLFRMFYAEHTIVINEQEGYVITERKQFCSPDSDDDTYITVDDENLEYCKYKTVKIGNIDK